MNILNSLLNQLSIYITKIKRTRFLLVFDLWSVIYTKNHQKIFAFFSKM